MNVLFMAPNNIFVSWRHADEQFKQICELRKKSRIIGSPNAIQRKSECAYRRKSGIGKKSARATETNRRKGEWEQTSHANACRLCLCLCSTISKSISFAGADQRLGACSHQSMFSGRSVNSVLIFVCLLCIENCSCRLYYWNGTFLRPVQRQQISLQRKTWVSFRTREKKTELQRRHGFALWKRRSQCIGRHECLSGGRLGPIYRLHITIMW